MSVAPIALGTMNLGGPTGPEASEQIILGALDAGFDLVDTADSYYDGASEAVLGEVLERSGRRDEVIVASKVGMAGDGDPELVPLSRAHVLAQCDASLRRLRTDRIDLYQLHRPSPTVPLEETLGACSELVDAGKVRWLGTSTHPAWLVGEAVHLAERDGAARIVSEQPPYNLLDRRIENELVPLCGYHGLAILPWSPMGGGILAGRYPRAFAAPAGSRAAVKAAMAERVTEPALAVAASVADLAASRGLTPGQLALLWVRDQPGVTAPIVGPRTVDHLRAAVAVLEHALDAEARAHCDDLVHPGNAVADFHNVAPWMRASVGP